MAQGPVGAAITQKYAAHAASMAADVLGASASRRLVGGSRTASAVCSSAVQRLTGVYLVNQAISLSFKKVDNAGMTRDGCLTRAAHLGSWQLQGSVHFMVERHEQPFEDLGGEPPEASVQVEPVGDGGVVLRLRGEIDVLTAPEVRKAIMEHVCDRSDWMIIDLDGVEFFGTTGLEILLEARDKQPELRLVCTNPIVLRVLQITALHELFAISPTVTEALAAVCPESGPGAGGVS